jgi:RNA polymerase sigma-70 factor (ECF subfamily)
VTAGTVWQARVAAVFRDEWGKVTAALTRSFGDLDLAEESVQDAFIAALERWPKDGMPTTPGAWITTTARRKAIDRLRRRSAFEARSHLLAAPEVDPEPAFDEGEIPDDRLALMFMCCHPALLAEGQIALTLRAVGGLTTGEIARAFLIPEATMAQRLTRAKRKIRRAGVPFGVPEADLVAERRDQVLHVLYLIFNEGYTVSAGDRLLRADLCAEAIRLGEVLVTLMPHDAEAGGLLALMLLHDARRAGRVDENGDLVPLERQDRARWDKSQIERGRSVLERALRTGGEGPYQVQAAIALAHAAAPSAAATDWVHIAWLYGRLRALQPTPIVELNQAVAVAMAEGPERGLALIDDLGRTGELDRYHLYHSARADLLRRAGRPEEAAAAYRRAIALTGNARERAYLESRLGELGESLSP